MTLQTGAFAKKILIRKIDGNCLSLSARHDVAMSAKISLSTTSSSDEKAYQVLQRPPSCSSSSGVARPMLSFMMRGKANLLLCVSTLAKLQSPLCTPTPILHVQRQRTKWRGHGVSCSKTEPQSSDTHFFTTALKQFQVLQNSS